MKSRIVALISAFTVAGAMGVMAAAPATKPTTGPATAPATGPTKTASGLMITKVEDGLATAQAGDIVWVEYTGKLDNGKQFDSSVGKDPIRFTLGRGEVIKGWDEGIAGMSVGERRTLVIPPGLAYGDKAMGTDIPANSTLHFDVKLIGIARIPAK